MGIRSVRESVDSNAKRVWRGRIKKKRKNARKASAARAKTPKREGKQN